MVATLAERGPAVANWLDPQAWNARNNPLAYTDPTGMVFDCWGEMGCGDMIMGAADVANYGGNPGLSNSSQSSGASTQNQGQGHGGVNGAGRGNGGGNGSESTVPKRTGGYAGTQLAANDLPAGPGAVRSDAVPGGDGGGNPAGSYNPDQGIAALYSNAKYSLPG